MKARPKTKIEDRKLTQKKGKRLQECRTLKGMTQQELAGAVGYEHSNSISQLETGAREMTWDKAALLSEVLEVRPEYLMCTSDLTGSIPRYSYESDVSDSIDLLFIYSLQLRGFDIGFLGVSELVEEEEQCISDMSSFVKFSLNMPDTCVIRLESGEQKEFMIQSVLVNGVRISVGRFLFIYNRIYDYIDFTFDNLKNALEDSERCDATDSMVTCTVAERSDGDLKLQAVFKSLKKELG